MRLGHYDRKRSEVREMTAKEEFEKLKKTYEFSYRMNFIDGYFEIRMTKDGIAAEGKMKLSILRDIYKDKHRDNLLLEFTKRLVKQIEEIE